MDVMVRSGEAKARDQAFVSFSAIFPSTLAGSWVELGTGASVRGPALQVIKSPAVLPHRPFHLILNVPRSMKKAKVLVVKICL